MVVDHIIPISAGGETAQENLCYSCVSCNSFKFNFQSGIDPDTQQEAPLYNPRKDQWNEHFRWSEDGSQIVGLTLVGRATVARLRMNQPNIVVARHVWISAGLHPPPYST